MFYDKKLASPLVGVWISAFMVLEIRITYMQSIWSSAYQKKGNYNMCSVHSCDFETKCFVAVVTNSVKVVLLYLEVSQVDRV